MEIRKFIFSIVTKYDKKGINAANKDAERLTKSAISATRAFEGLARAQLKAAKDAMALASAEGKAAANLDRLEREAERSSRSIAKMDREVKRLRTRLKTLQTFNLKAVGSSLQGASDRLGKFQSALAPIGQLARTAAAGIAAFTAASVAVGAAVISTGIEFESLRARLKTVEGSAAGASAAFAQIKEFTRTTPFELNEVTTAYIRLKNIGLDAGRESLMAFGNVAASQGRSMVDFIEAVADASTGEFERLKEFGIKASSQGDQVAFTFRGATTTVGKNAEEISNFLKGLGETEFAGAMEDQMATASGAISNLKDTFSTFLDDVAQLGVLDEFKGLLGDIAGAAGDQGLARVIADFLITGLRSLRELLSQITQEDVEEFFKSMIEVATALASAIDTAISAIRAFTDASGDAEAAIGNMALAMTALIALFAGPAGLVVAAGAAGAIVGRILANMALELTGVNDEIERLQVRNDALMARIAEHQKTISDIEQRNVSRNKAREARERERVGAVRQKVQARVGGLGAGLAREATEEELAGRFNLQQARDLSEQLVTREGGIVLEAVDRETARRARAAEERARAEAARAGAAPEAIEQAGANAKRAAQRAAFEQRQKAFESATEVFAVTGSAEQAAAAATAALETKAGKQAAKRRKGGKGPQFFAFEKEARQVAMRRGEAFAATELERLVSEGITAEAAIEQAREAGRQRARDLEQRFLEAGKIFEDTSDNVLDILGLRGPGSVLEGRPPPQNLTIAPHVEFTMIGEFNQTIESVESAAALEEITGRAAEAIPAAGLAEFEARMTAIVEAVFNLQVNRLIKADAGGKLPPGPQG